MPKNNKVSIADQHLTKLQRAYRDWRAQFGGCYLKKVYDFAQQHSSLPTRRSWRFADQVGLWAEDHCPDN